MNLKVGKEVLLKTDGMTQDGVELVKPNRIEPNTVETRPMDKNIERNM